MCKHLLQTREKQKMKFPYLKLVAYKMMKIIKFMKDIHVLHKIVMKHRRVKI